MLTSGTGISKLRLHSSLVIIKRTEVYYELVFFRFRLVLNTKMLKKLYSIPGVEVELKLLGKPPKALTIKSVDNFLPCRF